MKKYDLLVFIGRFQPLHLGHQEVIDRALSISDKVVVLVGSSNCARSRRNPLTYTERANMISHAYSGKGLLIRPLNDHTYNDSAWVTEVQEIVNKIVEPDARIGLIGCAKDHTSYYLKMFPDWDSEDVKFISPLNATAIRHRMFEEEIPPMHEWAAIMDTRVYRRLVEFRDSFEYQDLAKDHKFLIEYKNDWGEGPFLTADSLVQVGGKILLIERGKEYGTGLLAMPGGFLNKYEQFENAAIRELREETKLKVPDPVLRGSIKARKIFDDPHRSERGRIVTECFHIPLVNDTKLPEVRGSDDAAKAGWYDLAWVKDNPQSFFEDHYHIIKNMIGI